MKAAASSHLHSPRSYLAQEEGQSLVFFSSWLGLALLLIAGGWYHGVKTATVPYVLLNVQALLSAPSNNSFVVGDSGLEFNENGIEANLQRLANLSADIAQATGYANAVGAAAFYYRCDYNFPIPANPPDLPNPNPDLIASTKTENGLTLIQSDIDNAIEAACNVRMDALPDAQCSTTNINAALQLYICYGVIVYLKTDPVTPPTEIPQINIIAPGGPCAPPTPPPTT